ncbi:hypothetical protein NDU88_002561 [Pleurodeles waltl]|uniref:Uncharacterized protein n=1 Tax=Pleurodeles waltl TaxID=8319 RepID=A0AAV7NDZ9_PLEWA|nr:hypothetical protein NDU88_002561 [Pleurodeles waltl]
MPKHPTPRALAAGTGVYQDRDKPAQIQFSNISAGKGLRHSPLVPTLSVMKTRDSVMKCLGRRGGVGPVSRERPAARVSDCSQRG